MTVGQRGHAATPTASRSPIPARTRSVLDATECGADGSQVGADTFNDRHRGGSFVCSFPDGPTPRAWCRSRSRTPTAPDSDTTQTVTVANVAPTVTLSAGNDLSVNEGTSTPTASRSPIPAPTRSVSCAASCGANGSQVGTTSTTATGGSFVCSVPRRSGLEHGVGPGQGLRQRQQQHRHSDRDGRQRRPDGHAGGRQRPVGQRGHQHTYNFTVTDPGH